MVYPACATDQKALQCILFVYDHATRILTGGGDATAPVVHVSFTATLRDIMAGNGRGIFQPEDNFKNLPTAKAHLPGIIITLKRDYPYNTTSETEHIKPVVAYQAQFHEHEGEGRLTMDPVPNWHANASSRRSVSHPFAYYGLPYLLQAVSQAWQNERPLTTPPLKSTDGTFST